MGVSALSLKGLWARAVLHNVHYGDRHERLDALYRVNDPWGLDSPGELFRFEQTNRVIAREFAPVGDLLEIGCGEGHQSRHLAQACGRLHGCDISPRAVGRAGGGGRAVFFGGFGRA